MRLNGKIEQTRRLDIISCIFELQELLFRHYIEKNYKCLKSFLEKDDQFLNLD